MDVQSDRAREKTISDTEFIEQFRPETDENGDYYRHRHPEDDWDAIVEARESNRLWTVVSVDSDEDDTAVICSGYHYVDRLYYIICAVPFDPEIIYAIYDN